MLSQTEIETRLIALANHEHDARAADAILSRLDNLRPQGSISINEFDRTKRKMVNPGGKEFDFDPSLTPYTEKIGEALDHIAVNVVAVQGNTRSSKTTKAESLLLRNWTYGPVTNVLWVMCDKDTLNRYIDERGEEMLRIHPEVNEKVQWGWGRNSRNRKKIGNYTAFYMPATLHGLRSISAPIIIVDELDAAKKAVRSAMKTIITSRQDEYGTAAKAYLCSHPDAGMDDGIAKVLKDSLLHLWHIRCPHCGNASSPSPEIEAQGGHRLTWNVKEMMKRAEEMDRVAFLDYVAANVVLVCPHDGCHATFSPEERRALMATGQWLQPHQRWLQDGTVEGEARVSATMGFVIHAFMSPFFKLRETAKDWASAKLTADDTGNDIDLREVTVKKLGEVYTGAKDDEKVDVWKVVQTRLAVNYPLKVVPAGVLFLTAFVDVQGDRFEVVVVGWDLGKQSWLVDRYAIKQWPKFGRHNAFENIDPGNRLADWDVIEEAVLAASYPLQANPQRAEAGLPELFLPVARTFINSAGVPGVTNNARVWLSNLLSRQPGEGRIIPQYRIGLMQGSASKTGEVYGLPKQVMFDDMKRALPVPIFERYPNVHEIKRIIAKRMRIAEAGAGKMNLPSMLSPRYWRELTSERLTNGDWTPSGANETWDGYVACELGRATLQPDRPELWNGPVLPEWAEARPRGQEIETMVSAPVSVFDRLAALNDGA